VSLPSEPTPGALGLAALNVPVSKSEKMSMACLT
jgi:hypothetical protein